MGSSNSYHFMFAKLVIVVLVAASMCLADDAFVSTRATYYGSPDCKANPSGACGYGEYGRTVNNGAVAGVSRLYRNGSGCGSCYQVRCKIGAHCNDEGTVVVVTDFGVGHNTDFILTASAYANMAKHYKKNANRQRIFVVVKPNMAAAIFSYGIIDVEYRRVPCRYNSNLMIKVHERSSFPGYLAILPIYQSGIYDITSVQIWVEACKEWIEMRRVFGTVWDIQQPPIGVAISLRVQVVGGANAETKWLQLDGVIAAEWKAGVAYDAAVQLN